MLHHRITTSATYNWTRNAAVLLYGLVIVALVVLAFGLGRAEAAPEAGKQDAVRPAATQSGRTQPAGASAPDAKRVTRPPTNSPRAPPT